MGVLARVGASGSQKIGRNFFLDVDLRGRPQRQTSEMDPGGRPRRQTWEVDLEADRGGGPGSGGMGSMPLAVIQEDCLVH